MPLSSRHLLLLSSIRPWKLCILRLQAQLATLLEESPVYLCLLANPLFLETQLGWRQVNEDLAVYGLLKHVHMPEMSATIKALAGREQGLVFTPHLIPMTRGIMASIYCRGTSRGAPDTAACLKAAREFYAGRPFVKVTDKPLHTKWALGTNNVFVSYACDPARNLVIALGAIDNLGKGAAGQAVQNANLICDLPETAGLEGVAVWP